MLKFRWMLGAAAVLCTAFNLSQAADDDAYDLRGPAPEVGQKFVSKGTLKIKDADTTMKIAGQAITLKLNLVVTSEEEAKILAARAGWEGDFSEDPRVFWIPDELEFKYGFAIKQ